MATFHFEVKTGGKGTAAPHSLYIARQGKFRGRDDLVLTGSGNLPFWADGDPVKLWKAADAHERENGNAYREMIVALPNEIGVSGMRNLVEDLVTLLAGSKPYQFAVLLQLRQRKHFKQFFKSTDAARQRDKRIAQFDHFVFARRHIRRFNQFG